MASMGVVAKHESIDEQVALHRLDGRVHSRVRGREKSGGGHEKKTRVELLGAVGLNKASKLAVEPAGADFVVNTLTHLAPSRQRALHVELFDGANASIKGNPRHDLRVGEVPGPSARFPDASVRSRPDLFDVFEHGALKGPIGRL